MTIKVTNISYLLIVRVPRISWKITGCPLPVNKKIIENFSTDGPSSSVINTGEQWDSVNKII